MSSLPQNSGVYCILCVANFRYYIGSTKDLNTRWLQHLSDLRRNQHHSKYMQNCFNKYKEQSFVFIVLEYCDREHTIEREQYYLDNLKPFHPTGFNTSTQARHNTLGQKRPPETIAKIAMAGKGRKLSKEHKAMIGKKSADLWQDPDYRSKQIKSRTGLKRSSEFRERMRIIQTGRKLSETTIMRLSDSHKGKKLTPESVAKRSETNRKQYIATSPDGVEFRIKGLDRFCAEHGLRANQMSSVAKGKLKTCNGGWKCRYA